MATRTLFGFAGLAAGVVIGMSLAWVIPRDAPAPSPSTARDADAPVPDSVPPPASLDDTLRLPGNFRQTAALYEMLASADIPTLERLLAEAGTLASGQDATAARTIIYSRFVELDPERALADVLARGGPEQERYIHAVFENWAEIDPDAALDRVETLPERQRRDAAVAVLLARDDLPEPKQRALAARFLHRARPRPAARRENHALGPGGSLARCPGERAGGTGTERRPLANRSPMDRQRPARCDGSHRCDAGSIHWPTVAQGVGAPLDGSGTGRCHSVGPGRGIP